MDEQALWTGVVVLVDLALALLATGHAVLNKRDPRAAVMWIALAWIVPVLGAVAYALLGVNRVKRRAALLFPERTLSVAREPHASSVELTERLCGKHEQFRQLVRVMDRLGREPMTGGNRIEPLLNGDEAYPAMLDAIDSAHASVVLCSYIFDNDAVGGDFCAALERAAQRGVAVRVLIDDVGRRYSWPPVDRRLRRAGVRVQSFLPTWMPANALLSNLRNHRKILVVDGRVGFTGGMNIRQGHVLAARPKHPVADLHFRLEGPVVAHLAAAFAEDWAMTSGEVLAGELWFPELAPAGACFARGILDGPDENLDVLRLLFLAALDCATKTVRIATPYFLPDAALVTSLGICALRGVQVDILLPERNNIRLVEWAQNGMLWQVLKHGCRVHLCPGPFDHTKLFVVDDVYTLLGSANWDARSLRLNFEFNVECFDEELTRRVTAILDQKQARARRVDMESLASRPLWVRLRDGSARLLSPYL
jgi:cardiolipin synthase